MKKQWISMVFVNVMWGLSFIASKHAMNAGFTPMTLALFRYVVASACLVPITLLTEKRMPLRKQDVLPMILSGLTGITFYYFFEYYGIQRTSTVNASLILAAIPILTMLAEAVVYKTRLRPAQVAGAVISMIGVGMILFSGSNEGEASIVGDLLIMGASIVWVAYIFIGRRLRSQYTSLSMNSWQAITALITLLPLAVGEGCDLASIPWDGWAAMAVLAVICSALCYYLYGNALFEMSPLASAIFINLIPLTTMVGGVVLLGETLTWLTVVGGGMVIGSIFLVNMTEKKA
ncbi:MAG: DMT family transporter [Clostridia bacterium]|nr:DMT family transporter [Clostridia bacterium]